MWPWGHAILAYGVVTLLMILYRRRSLGGAEAVAVVIGSQIPDLIDKPLGWTLGLLPSGRSLGHSLFTWVVLSALLVLLLRRLDRQSLALPVIGGFLVGILTDVPRAVLAGDFSMATFLLWPVLPSPVYDVEPSILANFARVQPADVERLLLFAGALIGIHLLLSWFRPPERLASD